MKQLIGAALIAAAIVGGCATNRELTSMESLPVKTEVFTGSSSSQTETEMATTDIVFSVKSLASRFLGRFSKHTDPPFRVHVTIDGHTTILDAEPVLENKLSANINTPEHGTGWRYQFNRRITLAPGKHTLTIAIPVDGVRVDREILLQPGVNTITLSPVYKKRGSQRPVKEPHFSAGVKTLEVLIK